jgi:predicted nucleotidyltransferase
MISSQSFTTETIIQQLQKTILTLKSRFGIRRLALYGSYSTGKQTPNSDVDLLVELSHPLGLEFIRMASLLEEALGRKVDLATFDSLQRSAGNPQKKHIAKDVERTLIDVWRET